MVQLKKTYLLSQNEVGKNINVVISYTDGRGTKESVNSDLTDNIANINDAHAGTLTITGKAIQKQVLTVKNTLQDADGLGAIKYQWFANNVAINNAKAIPYYLPKRK